MFDLDARVHFDEIPFTGIVIDEEFHGASVGVVDGTGEFDGGVAEAIDDVLVESVARGLFDDFLVTALDGAVAFVEVEDVTVFVGEDLHLDVFGFADEFFQEDGAIAEGASGFGLCFVEEFFEIFGFAHDAHAASAAAVGSFDDEREADFFGDIDGLFAVGYGVICAFEDGHVEFASDVAGGGFVAHHVEDGSVWADESDAVVGAGFGEVGIFGEEAVAWVDGVDAFFFGEGDDAVDIEVSADGAFVFIELVGFVSFEAMGAEAVFVGVDGDRADAEFGGGSHDADGDLGAVGDEEFFEVWKRFGCCGFGHGKWISARKGYLGKGVIVTGRRGQCKLKCRLWMMKIALVESQEGCGRWGL